MTVVPLDKKGVDLCRRCMASPRWAAMYGVSAPTSDLESFVAERFLTPYPYVRRYQVCRNTGEVIAFSVIDFRSHDSDTCILFGGIDPMLINSGIGPRVTACMIDFLFASFTNIEAIETYPHNRHSTRLDSRIGFVRSLASSGKQAFTLVLHRHAFPNPFCMRLLRDTLT